MSTRNDDTAILRLDFKNIRALATCSICDQLLYEPWTIACGHTYCYSCLCSWFSQDKRKKSCPECRSKVKTIPAPSFLIKQVVELIIKRSELMPADETIEQHQKKRAEEMSLVDDDKSSEKGLFKGMFTTKLNKLWRDDSDGVLRCPSCGFEHEGGPLCTNCGEQVSEDMDEDGDEYVEADRRNNVELDAMGFDLDVESDEDRLYNFHNHHHFQQNIANYIDMAYPRRPTTNFTPDHLDLVRDSVGVNLMEDSDSEYTVLSESSSEINDDRDSSLEDFIIPDGEDEDEDDDSSSNRSFDDQQNNQSSPNHQQHTITISDEVFDEGGEISNRRQIRRRNNTYPSINEIASPIRSANNLADTSSDESETGLRGSEVQRSRFTEWSSSDHENQSESESDKNNRHNPSSIRFNHRYESNDGSHTNTEVSVNNETSDDENSIPEARHSDSEMSYYAASGTRNKTNRFSSESSNSRSVKKIPDRSPSACWDRHPNEEINSSLTDDENEYKQHRTRPRHSSPYFGGNGEISRKIPLSTDSARRKRPALESSILDTETETDYLNSGSRRSKTWALSRKRNNYQANKITSPARNEQSASSSEGKSYLSSQPESAGLANVVHMIDEESDDSIQPPSRRRLRKRSSKRCAGRYQARICAISSRPHRFFRNSHVNTSHMIQPTSRKYHSRFVNPKTAACRTISEEFLHNVPRHASSSVIDTSVPNLIPRISRHLHARIQF